MYRVVLIDDESRIVEGLRRVVRWEDYNCEVAGAAGSADEGAALIKRLRPHILFTDIRMPGKDGLTMVAGLRSEFPDMQVAILTGYRDFTYAQEAIRLGVTRFLLKPSKMDEIKDALVAMVEQLDKRTEASGGEEEPAQHAGSFIVNQALDYMEKNYRQKLGLQTVADCCYVSQWHLSKLLNRYQGKSFYDILNAIRINKAKTMLADPSLKIWEISEAVGYTDTAHFARTFKKLVGMSANEYRNSLR